LVINPNKDLIERRSKDEPTGEVLSLTAADIAVKMGDKYQRTKPKLLEEEQKKKYLILIIYFFKYCALISKFLENKKNPVMSITYQANTM
jgi:hypothetical protein